jgi:hypothetical protein
MRMGLVSAGAIAAVNQGLTVAVGGLVAKFTAVDVEG